MLHLIKFVIFLNTSRYPQYRWKKRLSTTSSMASRWINQVLRNMLIKIILRVLGSSVSILFSGPA